MSKYRAVAEAQKLRRRSQPGQDLPVDVHGIASQLGIEVVERQLTETSGLLLRREGRTICVVNRRHSATRKRFTIAHELAHHALHPPKESYDLHVSARDQRSSEGTFLEEIEANAFAAELLMPEELVRARVPKALDLFLHEERIGRLATDFKVSREAMTHRLTNLGLLTPSSP